MVIKLSFSAKVGGGAPRQIHSMNVNPKRGDKGVERGDNEM